MALHLRLAIIFLFFQLPLFVYSRYYVGPVDDHDQYLKNHYMYNRSIAVYHRHQSDHGFCYDKSVGFYSMGLCKNFYAHCDETQSLTMMICADQNEIYLDEISKCVDQTSIDHRSGCNFETPITQNHPDCRRENENQFIKFSDCNREYGICSKGNLYRVECAKESETYSEFYGSCIDKSEDAKCHSSRIDQSDQKINSMKFDRLSTMCDNQTKNDYEIYLGPCNKRYLLCGTEGWSFVGECEKNQVIDQGARCVPISDSDQCPSNWGLRNGDAEFVQYMNYILKSTGYCKSKSDGLYTEPFGRCRRESIFCFQQEGTFHLCPRGQGLDSQGKCISKRYDCLDFDAMSLDSKPDSWRSNFLTIFGSDIGLCQAQEIEGTHTFGHCQKFFAHCHLGQFEIQTCPHPHEIFDADMNQCRFPSLEDRCDRSDSIAAIVGRCSNIFSEEASKLLPIDLCVGAFLVCVQGGEVALKCDRSDHAFNEAQQTCLRKIENPECPEYIPVLIPTIPVEPSTEDVIVQTCEGDGGFYNHESDCTKYYRCAHGRLIEMNCGTGTAWDEKITTCNHKHEVARCKDLNM